MSNKWDECIRQPLLSDRPASANRWARLSLFAAWLALTAWLAWDHVPWRDEVRAWSLMLTGEGWTGMFRAVHGEGHPYLWYILLKAGHTLFGVREVLPALGLLVGAAAAALLALRAPFRLGVIAILLFSLHLGWDFSVVSRNYGLTALILFWIAITYPRVRNSPWFGVQLLLLCNTNAPSVFLAGAMLLYRMVEWALERPPLRSRQTVVLAVNGLLLLLGTLLCFLAIYPPVNDAAAAVARVPVTPINLVASLADAERSFGALGFDGALLATNLFILLSLGVFVRSRPAIIASVAAFLTMKLFFFFAFPAAYRHAALFLMLLVALLWIEANKRDLRPQAASPEKSLLPLLASWALVMLLAIQSLIYLRGPVLWTLQGKPWSSAAELAALLQRPEHEGAILMVDPDALGESVVYYTGRPFWLLRQGRLGTVTPFSLKGNTHLALDDFLRTAGELHGRTRRPVIIALKQDLSIVEPGRYDVMYGSTTTYTPANIARFQSGTRKIASFRNAFGDENYDVYRFPR